MVKNWIWNGVQTRNSLYVVYSQLRHLLQSVESTFTLLDNINHSNHTLNQMVIKITHSPEDIIRQHVRLTSARSHDGWNPILCKVCNDHGRKGPRAGFKFDEGGNVVGYHCFNCGHTAVFDSSSSSFPSKKFITVLKSFGIDDTAFKDMAISNRLSSNKTKPLTLAKHRPELKYEPKEIELLNHFKSLENEKDSCLGEMAIDYLHERGVDWRDQPFYISDDPKFPKWLGRLIIPVYKQKKLIFYSGRDLTGLHLRKYVHSYTDRQAVMYGFNNILDFTRTDPIYIVEGWFDATAVDGVAVFGTTLTPEQIYWLNRSDREKIIIPDRDAAGFKLVRAGLAAGYSIATPDIGSHIDVSDAVNHYGKLYVMKSLKDNTLSGKTAELMGKIYCKVN